MQILISYLDGHTHDSLAYHFVRLRRRTTSHCIGCQRAAVVRKVRTIFVKLPDVSPYPTAGARVHATSGDEDSRISIMIFPRSGSSDLSSQSASTVRSLTSNVEKELLTACALPAISLCHQRVQPADEYHDELWSRRFRPDMFASVSVG